MKYVEIQSDQDRIGIFTFTYMAFEKVESH